MKFLPLGYEEVFTILAKNYISVLFHKVPSGNLTWLCQQFTSLYLYYSLCSLQQGYKLCKE